MKAKSALIAAVASVGIAGGVQADTLFVDLTGFQSHQGFHLPGGGLNTGIILPNFGGGAGTQITNIQFTNFTFHTVSANSWTSELVVSVNDWDGTDYTEYWDSTVPGTTNAPGAFGPSNANFNNPGQFGSGPFTMTAGHNDLYITVYETFNDAGQDAQVDSGGITITYTPIPAPGALALLGLAGIVGGRRRRS